MELNSNYFPIASLIAAALRNGFPISVLVLEQQAQQMELLKEHIYEQIRKNHRVVADYIEPGCKQDLQSTSGLTGGSTYKMRQTSKNGKSLIGSFLSGTFYRAPAVSELNVAMGRIVAALIAGGCGILSAALLAMQEERGSSERDCVVSSFTASTVGMVIANNAPLVGAQGGCQVEYDSATAMATVAAMELAGGIPDMMGNTIAIAIKNILRLVCDPTVGLVGIPCIKRNASDVTGVLVAAELVLAGIESAIPTDEIIRIAKKMGNAISSTLKETAEGSLAVTPTGGRLHKQIFGTTEELGRGCGSCGGCPP